MDKKKILITGSTFPRWENDTEPRFILDYAKSMLKYYDVTVLVPAAPGAEDEQVMEGVKIKRYHYFPVHRWETLCYPGAIVPRIKEKKIRALLVPFLFVALYRNLKELSKKTDIVHSHWILPQGIVQSFIKDTPYVVTGHGGDVTSLNNIFMLKLKIRCLKRAKKITVVSNYLYEKLNLVFPNAKTQVISMGCDVEKFSPKKRIKNYFGQDGRKTILFVGRLVGIKGVNYLIDAMQYINARLYIVGKGPMEKELKEQAAQYSEKIFFLGPKTHQELPEIYASADVFVAPSIIDQNGAQEGLPVSIMEAMASGLPVICGISGGVKDIVHDGINGYAVDATDVKTLAQHINHLLTDENKLCSFSAEALRTAQEFSYDNIAQKFHNVLETI